MPKKNAAKRVAKKVAPPKRRMCAAMQVHNRLLELYPSYRTAQTALATATSRRMLKAFVGEAAGGVTKIPVVVHVVFNSASENISDAQVKSQIDVLNKDFRAKNPDKSKVPSVWKGLATDAGIEFELATKDPQGKPTTGITRTQTAETSFAPDDSVKSSSSGGVNAWPTKKYLNIWVCKLSDQLLGYAQFPGGPAATDGVVILNTAFGTVGTAATPFNKGRTTTHEIGHWLNLRHIWADTEDCSGTDFVPDTPNALVPNFGKPTFPVISCGNGPNGDMFMNYMDYVDDAAMFMFTTQQVTRMHAALEGPRKSLGK